jgi:hypothetical protein
LPQTIYFYGIIAFSDTAISDTSNIGLDTTEMQPLPPPVPPTFTVLFDSSLGTATINYLNGSEFHYGIIIYREDNFSDRNVITSIRCPDSSIGIGDTSYIDRGINPGTFFKYSLQASSDSDTTETSGTSAIFYHGDFPYNNINRGSIYLSDFISDFPISFLSAGNAMLLGDSVFISEPSGTAVINVQNASDLCDVNTLTLERSLHHVFFLNS